MKTRILGMAIGLGALWAWSPGCSQPKPECNVGSASAYGYVANVTLVSGDADCNPAYATGFEEVGMQVYNPTDGSGKLPDTSRKLVALQTLTIGGYAQNAIELDEATVPYSLGEYTDILPNEENICTATGLTTARIVQPVVPGTAGAGGVPPNEQDPADIQIEWSDVSWYVTTANLGNQAEGTFTYTDNLAGCSATYKALMMWPIVSCEDYKFYAPVDVTDADDDGEPDNPCDPKVDLSNCRECDPNVDEFCDALPTGEPNDALCDDQPEPDPPYELPLGSGISPDLNVSCKKFDQDHIYCFLATDTMQRPQNE
ncbi:MAG TPA: hypothetical protein VLS89_12895 [Candidatus Nanopelagicales bacterium]|nr:hypothetical protein [Candidatus Nanopelagicales bacterium]